MTTMSTPRSRAIFGPLAGLLSLAAGLVSAEVVSGITPSFKSPVVGVGDRFIDVVPGWLKTWAIDTFGTGDKAALLIGIVVVVSLAALAAGHLASRRDRAWGDAFAVALAAVAMLCVYTGRNGSFVALVPSLVAGLVGAGILRALIGWIQRQDPTTSAADVVQQPVSPEMATRRRFIKGAVSVAAIAAVGVSLSRRAQRTAESAKQRLAVVLPGARKVLPQPPSDPAKTTAGLTPLFTPNDSFYRIDTALVVPQVDASTWKLRVEGYVDRPAMYTYDDLLKMEFVEVDCTIACVSNEVGGNLIGNARWLGIPLKTLLDKSGIQSKADQVFTTSVDGFTAGFPVEALDGRDAILAIGMNGEPLPVLNGFPARLIIPGIYGYVSATKWISSIKLSRFDEDQGYWLDKGWSRLAPIKTHSRIDRPTGRVKPGKDVIAGVAWAPTIGIDKVEVRANEGEWREAKLGPEVSANCWRQWWIEWDLAEGETVFECRATDSSGYVQTAERVPVAPDGATGYHARVLFVGA